MLRHLSFFLHFFLSYLLSYLSFPLRIDPLHFQAGYRKRRLNLALFFVFILCRSTFLLIGECVLLLRYIVFFHTKTGSGKRLRNDIFCVERDIEPQLSQLANKANCRLSGQFVLNAVLLYYGFSIVGECRQ